MIPVIALVGRPNVGKSTLFNVLTRSNNALVADQPGLTRDRQYGDGALGDKPFIVIDTGGIFDDEDKLTHEIESQVSAAIADASHILFMVDGHDGLTGLDEQIAGLLRKQDKPLTVVMNKADGLDERVATAEFAVMGLGMPQPIAAVKKRGVKKLITALLDAFVYDELESEEDEDENKPIKVAVIGRPNVGKSTLINQLLGEERVIAYDMPGTTRDSIFIPFTHKETDYTLIDTAGVRRKKSAADMIEKFSIAKTLQSIKMANVVIMVIDAKTNVVEQDLHLLQYVVESGRALVVTINKWDGLDSEQKDAVKEEVRRRLQFVDYVRMPFISALKGTGIRRLMDYVLEAYQCSIQSLSTPELTRILEQALEAHQPPLINGRRIKLRYAHAGGKNPPRIVIHGNQTSALAGSYLRYLEKSFRKSLDLKGTPVAIELRTGDNPYEGKHNTLTPRQERKKKRMMKFVKKKK